MEYSNEDRGVLFTNKKKVSDKHPDMTGNIEVSSRTLDYLNNAAKMGEELKVSVSAWKKKGKAGSFLSLSISEPYKGGRESTYHQPRNEEIENDDPSDEIPF